jgi:hypothetical protein
VVASLASLLKLETDFLKYAESIKPMTAQFAHAIWAGPPKLQTARNRAVRSVRHDFACSENFTFVKFLVYRKMSERPQKDRRHK